MPQGRVHGVPWVARGVSAAVRQVRELSHGWNAQGERMSLRSLAALATLVLIPVGAVRAQRADNPHGPSIGPCATCHAPDSWRPVRISKEFRHAERSFPLEGVHARTSCMACHKNLVFDKLANTC